MLVSGESRAECGGILTLADNRLLSLVVKAFGFEEILIVDVAPVVAPRATLAESLVHAGLGLGPVLNYGAGRERAFGAGHDGGWGKGRGLSAEVYIGEIIKRSTSLVTSCGSKVSTGPSHKNIIIIIQPGFFLLGLFPRPFEREHFFRPRSHSSHCEPA